MERLLDSLNPQQKEAALCIDEHVRIVAGAGSGKTRVLMARIEYLIRDLGIFPSRIMAITFTNKAANEMKERLEKQCPLDAKDVRISTIHALCVRILREDAAAANLPKNFTILDAEDQKSILRKIYKELELSVKDFPPGQILSTISKWKTEGKSVEQMKNTARSYFMQKTIAIFEMYQKILDGMKALDFDDLLIKTENLLKTDRTVREKWQNRLDYIHVDEFQDVDPIQYSIIQSLVRQDAILCVVGDPDQTIYTWRGASVDIIMNFEEDFHPSKTVILNQNYRSTTPILKASNALIANNRNRVKKDLFTEQKGDDVIELLECNDDEAEGYRLAGKMKALHKKGMPWSDMAVLYRANYLSRAVEKALRVESIPYRIFGGIRFYERAEIKDMLAYLHLLAAPDENDPNQMALDLFVERVINVPKRAIGPKFMAELQSEADEQGCNLLEATKDPQTLKAASAKKARSFYQLIQNLKKDLEQDIQDKDIPEIIDQILLKTGYRAMLLEKGEEGKTRLENVEELQRDMQTFFKEDPSLSLEEYLQNVSLFTDHAQTDSQNAVNLMTVHAAKGTEYPAVFVAGLNEGIFPSQRAVSEGGASAMEEERRLLYVAMTRAKKRLFLSWNHGFSYQAGGSKTASRLLGEVPLEYTDRAPEPEHDEGSSPAAARPNQAFGPAASKKKKPALTLNETRVKRKKKSGSLQPGAVVLHKIFGTGVVISNSGTIIQVAFGQPHGTKKIAASYLEEVKA